jgi:hypothetical protein
VTISTLDAEPACPGTVEPLDEPGLAGRLRIERSSVGAIARET